MIVIVTGSLCDSDAQQLAFAVTHRLHHSGLHRRWSHPCVVDRKQVHREVTWPAQRHRAGLETQAFWASEPVLSPCRPQQ